MLEALWKVDARKLICRNDKGLDTSNLLSSMVHGAYTVSMMVLGGRQLVIYSGLSFKQATDYIIAKELPRRLAHVKRMKAWSAIHKKRLSFKPERVLSLHGNMPSKTRMLKSECLQRSTSDPLSQFTSRRDNAENTTYSGKLDTPWASRIFKERVRSRKANDAKGCDGR